MMAEECMHCEINQLVHEHMQRGEDDLAALASMVVESLADLILLAPPAEQSKLMADALSQFGHVFLEKSNEDGGASTATH